MKYYAVTLKTANLDNETSNKYVLGIYDNEKQAIIGRANAHNESTLLPMYGKMFLDFDVEIWDINHPTLTVNEISKIVGAE